MVYVTAMPASANTEIREGSSPMDFVRASHPQWNFTNGSCRASQALHGWNGSPGSGTPDNGASETAWPDADSGCPTTDEDFPTYFTYKNCNPQDIRVVFSIYQRRSGFTGGHRHDFEHVIVHWRRYGDTWKRETLIVGAHGKLYARNWGRVESWNADKSDAGLGREHPRAFVGWGTHAMFNDKGGSKDIFSTLNRNEYRTDDFREWSSDWLVEVNDGGALAQRFDQLEGHFGSADSNPGKMARTVCDRNDWISG
jgi:hypothetical protein